MMFFRSVFEFEFINNKIIFNNLLHMLWETVFLRRQELISLCVFEPSFNPDRVQFSYDRVLLHTVGFSRS